MPIKPNDLVTVAKGKPIWRSLSSDEIVAWHLSPEAKQTMPDGSARLPPDGKLGSSDGVTRYRVALINRVSLVFGHARKKCAVIISHKGMKWFCYMADLEEVNLGGADIPARSPDGEDPNRDLMESVAADLEPLPVGKYEDDGFGQLDLVPYTNEEIAALELARRERDAQRLQLAMAEFGELNLEARRRVKEIVKKYGLRDNWTGMLQIRIEGEKK